LLPPKTRVGLALAARARDISVEQLAMVGDDLIAAVLDDAHFC
jgi:hypothetical protein